MTFKITTKLSMPLNQFESEIPARIANMGRVIGRAVSDRIAQTVTNKIPGGGGWYSIYRKAIAYKESPDGTQWAIAGFAEVELSDPPADATLIAFRGDKVDGRLLAPYNPWPIDMIPPISGGYSDNVDVYPAGEGTVATNRDRVSGLLDLVKKSLTDNSFSLLPDFEMLEIKGKRYVDLAYLARRMELGYEGFPRHPHWGPASSKAARQGEKWGSTGEVRSKVDNALLGGDVGSVDEMTEAEAQALAERRAATWS